MKNHDAKSLREMAGAHRKAGRGALADTLDKQAAALDGAKGKAAVAKKKKRKATKKKAARKAPAATKKKKKRAAKPKAKKKTKAKRKPAAKKAPAKKKRKSSKRARMLRKLKARKNPAKTLDTMTNTELEAELAKLDKKPRKSRAKKPAKGGVKVGGSKPAKGKGGKGGKGRKKSKAITKSQRLAAIGDTDKVYLFLPTGKKMSRKQVKGKKNPTGSVASIGVTFLGVVNGMTEAFLLDRAVANMLTADEKKEQMADGAPAHLATGRDAMRRNMMKPGAARIATSFGYTLVNGGLSLLIGKHAPLFSDFFMGRAVGGGAFMLAFQLIIPRVLPMLPGKMVDGNEVTWQGWALPEYQDVPQAALAAYVAKNLVQVIDHTNGRLDAIERYDRKGSPYDLEIGDVLNAQAAAAAGTSSGGTSPMAPTSDTPDTGSAGLGALGAKRKAANSPDNARIMAAAHAAKATERDYAKRYQAPATVGKACCDSCAHDKPCEKDCAGKSQTDSGVKAPMVNTNVPPEVSATNLPGGAANPASPQPDYQMGPPGSAAPPGAQQAPGIVDLTVAVNAPGRAGQNANINGGTNTGAANRPPKMLPAGNEPSRQVVQLMNRVAPTRVGPWGSRTREQMTRRAG